MITIQNFTKRKFPYITADQAAERLGVTKRCIQQRCWRGAMPCIKIGNSTEARGGGQHYLIHVDDLAKAIAKDAE